MISTTQRDIDEEKENASAEDRLEGIPMRAFSDGYLETLAVYRKLAAALLPDNILLFHGSCVCVDGERVVGMRCQSRCIGCIPACGWIYFLSEDLCYISGTR